MIESGVLALKKKKPPCLSLSADICPWLGDMLVLLSFPTAKQFFLHASNGFNLILFLSIPVCVIPLLMHRLEAILRLSLLSWSK